MIHDEGDRIRNVRKAFEAACKRAGLEGVTPHTLKHTAASWLIQSSVSYGDAAEFLSTSEKVLRDTYAHLHPEHQTVAAEALCKGRISGSRMGP